MVENNFPANEDGRLDQLKKGLSGCPYGLDTVAFLY
jgi:hypothetical protein